MDCSQLLHPCAKLAHWLLAWQAWVLQNNALPQSRLCILFVRSQSMQTKSTEVDKFASEVAFVFLMWPAPLPCLWTTCSTCSSDNHIPSHTQPKPLSAPGAAFIRCTCRQPLPGLVQPVGPTWSPNCGSFCKCQE